MSLVRKYLRVSTSNNKNQSKEIAFSKPIDVDGIYATSSNEAADIIYYWCFESLIN